MCCDIHGMVWMKCIHGIHKGSAWVSAGTHASDRAIYLTVYLYFVIHTGTISASRSDQYVQDQVNAKCYRKKAMPSSKKRFIEEDQ